MGWPKPKHSKGQVSRAGSTLIDPKAEFFEWRDAYDVLANWRACHGYPINTFQATLRLKLKSIDPNALVAQRLKRLPSILRKLERQRTMQLARMQDIGGIRAVLAKVSDVRALEASYRNSRFAHQLVGEHDYIANPKISGYRSIHLVYRYKNKNVPDYDGLHVELQIRTRLQHAWAMAVETMGTMLNQSLKASECPDAWLHFFQLASSAFAHFEKCPLVPGFESLDRDATFLMTAQEARTLGIKEKLIGFSSAVRSIPINAMRAGYYLIILDLEGKTVTVEPFNRQSLEAANTRYAEIEQELALGRSKQVVLVSAGSVESLRRAYPSYFLDTQEFLVHLGAIERVAARVANA